MTAEGFASRVRVAEERLDGIRDGLIAATPERLQNCTGQMEMACGELAGVSEESSRACGDPEALRTARRLHGKIKLTRRLLDNVWRFHKRWGQILGASAGGYLAGGQVAPIRNASRFSVRG